MTASALKTPPGYHRHDETTLPEYLAGCAAVASTLGGTFGDWTVSEVGDGNLNLVFVVRGPAAAVVVKQALPYVRLVGESWPLPLTRAHFENLALTEQGRLATGLVPEILHYDEAMALIVMEYLSPHIIMRRGMIDAVTYPCFSNHISTFMANTLFFTSDLALSAAEKKGKIAAFCGNTALCKITEDLIFTDPYRVADMNRWTSPQLDRIAAEFRDDGDLKVAVSRLKLRFLSSAEAMIHGDLHTGSVMVTESETKVIDPEFAFFGPMGFDVGAVIANLLLNYFSQDGHATAAGSRDAYAEWVLDTTEQVWREFRRKFLALWRDHGTGDAYPADLFDEARMNSERNAYLDRLFQDTLGFCAAKMIRRILGLAHNIDLEWIEDTNVRAACETRALRLARELMVNAASFRDIGQVCDAAREMRRLQPSG